jgi:hypothetical protein
MARSTRSITLVDAEVLDDPSAVGLDPRAVLGLILPLVRDDRLGPLRLMLVDFSPFSCVFVVAEDSSVA